VRWAGLEPLLRRLARRENYATDLDRDRVARVASVARMLPALAPKDDPAHALAEVLDDDERARGAERGVKHVLHREDHERIGRLGAEVVARDPLVGGALVHAAAHELSYIDGDEALARRVLGWLERAIATQREGLALAAEEPARGAAAVLFRWLHALTALYAERIATFEPEAVRPAY